MHMILKRLIPFFLVLLAVTAVLPSQLVSPVGRVAAQGGTPDPSGVPVVIKGVVQSISGNTWVVANVTVTVTSTTVITGYPVIGSIVEISGKRGDDGKVVVVTVSLNPATPAPTMSATEKGTEEPEGTKSPTPAGTMKPTSAATQPATGIQFTEIIVEGPVEAIIVNTGTVIVVYGQHIRLRDDDPLKLKIKIGDWIHLKGHFDRDDQDQIIVVAVVVVVIVEPAPVIIIPSGGGAPSGGGGGGDGKGHHGDDD